MKLDKILVVHRKSWSDLYSSKLRTDLKNLMKETSTTLKSLEAAHKEHCLTMEAVKKTFKDCKMVYRGNLKKYKNLDNYDLVVGVGGDGTFLEISHYVKDTPVFFINSDYKESEGFFAAAKRSNLEEKVKKLFNGKLKSIKLNRIQAEINGTKIKELALNDIMITHKDGGAGIKYILKIGNKTIEHLNYGLVIGTAAGSTAAVNSAGGKVLPIRSKKIQYATVAPYIGRRLKPKMLKGILNKEGIIEAESKMGKGKICIDGHYVNYHFGLGCNLKVYNANQPLSVIGLDEKNRKKYY